MQQVSVESLSNIQKRLTIVVSHEALDAAVSQQLAKLSKTAKINGFRAGKAPMDVIKQRFGDSARQEALNEVIQNSFYGAINQEKFNLAGAPLIQPKPVQPGQPLEFVATFEVVPEIENVNFTLDTLEKDTASISEPDVDQVVLHLQNQHATWKKTDRAAQDKDKVVIDFSGSIDGTIFPGGEAHDFSLILGSKSMIPGFEEGIVGKKAGEEFIVTVNFPEDYFAKEVAGKAAEFKIKLHQVLQPELPELTESYVKKLGVKSGMVEDLRTEVRKNLEREATRLVAAKLKDKIFEVLLKQNPIEIPKSMIHQEAERIHNELHPHHNGEKHNHSEGEMEVFNKAAERNVALALLIRVFAKQKEVTLNQDKVEAHVQTLSSVYENPEEVKTWFLNNKKAMNEIHMQVLEDQVIEKLLENVKVTENVLSYNELVKSVQTKTM